MKLICPGDHNRAAELWGGMLDGDEEAAYSAICLAPNDNRGALVREAYDANIPNPAFRTLVCAGWNHDHDQLVLTARNRMTTLRRWFERAAFDVSHLPDVVTAYRGAIVPDGQPPVLAACGLSWTLSQERAHYFADYWRRRGAKGKCVVVEAQIKRRYIKAYIDEREEQELVVFASGGQLRPIRVVSCEP